MIMSARAESVATVTSISEPCRRQTLTRKHRDGVKVSKSSTVSIPSNYQTHFISTQEPFGFNSCTKRSLASGNINDHPGPGTYTVLCGAIDANKESFSKRGSGGFASKSSRFYRTRSLDVGPGSYTPREISYSEDFNRAGVTRNFKKPIIEETNLKLPQWPSPNSYNVTDINVGHSVYTTGVGFKSKAKRVGFLKVNDHPGPGSYTPNEEVLYKSSCPQRASFISETKRDDILNHKSEGPGPADYIISSHNSKRLPIPRQKHYLCISAPAIPLPALPPPPGPGHYEVNQPIAKKAQLVTGAVFKSTSSRWNRITNGINAPGPGAYEPQPLRKQSFLFNYNRNWV